MVETVAEVLWGVVVAPDCISKHEPNDSPAMKPWRLVVEELAFLVKPLIVTGMQGSESGGEINSANTPDPHLHVLVALAMTPWLQAEIVSKVTTLRQLRGSMLVSSATLLESTRHLLQHAHLCSALRFDPHVPSAEITLASVLLHAVAENANKDPASCEGLLREAVRGIASHPSCEVSVHPRAILLLASSCQLLVEIMGPEGDEESTSLVSVLRQKLLSNMGLLSFEEWACWNSEPLRSHIIRGLSWLLACDTGWPPHAPCLERTDWTAVHAIVLGLARWGCESFQQSAASQAPEHTDGDCHGLLFAALPSISRGVELVVETIPGALPPELPSLFDFLRTSVLQDKATVALLAYRGTSMVVRRRMRNPDMDATVHSSCALFVAELALMIDSSENNLACLLQALADVPCTARFDRVRRVLTSAAALVCLHKDVPRHEEFSSCCEIFGVSHWFHAAVAEASIVDASSREAPKDALTLMCLLLAALLVLEEKVLRTHRREQTAAHSPAEQLKGLGYDTLLSILQYGSVPHQQACAILLSACFAVGPESAMACFLPASLPSLTMLCGGYLCSPEQELVDAGAMVMSALWSAAHYSLRTRIFVLNAVAWQQLSWESLLRMCRRQADTSARDAVIAATGHLHVELSTPVAMYMLLVIRARPAWLEISSMFTLARYVLDQFSCDHSESRSRGAAGQHGVHRLILLRLAEALLRCVSASSDRSPDGLHTHRSLMDLVSDSSQWHRAQMEAASLAFEARHSVPLAFRLAGTFAGAAVPGAAFSHTGQPAITPELVSKELVQHICGLIAADWGTNVASSAGGAPQKRPRI